MKTSLGDYNEAIRLGSNCNVCPLRNKLGPVYPTKAVVSSPFPFDITIVGERPSDTDLNRHLLFSDTSGKHFDKLVKQWGLERQHFSTDSATLCSQREYLKEADWNKAITHCSGRLTQAAKLVSLGSRKSLVILAGRKALQAICGHSKLAKWRGYPVKPADSSIARSSVIYFPTYSPFQVKREPYLLPVWKTDIQRALMFASGELTEWKWPPIEVGAFNEKVLDRLFQLANGPARRVGFDTETGRADPLVARLDCIGFGTKEWGICAEYGKNPEADQLFKRILARSDLTLSGQNITHDILVTEAHGLGPVKCKTEDLLNMIRVRHPQLDADLGSIASYYFPVNKWKEEFKDGKEDQGKDAWGESLSQEDMNTKMVYCSKDSIMTDMCITPASEELEAPL